MPTDNPIASDPLRGLFSALLNGSPAVQDHMRNTGQSLDQIMASLWNDASASSGDRSPSEPFGDLLGTMMGGAPQSGDTPTPNAGGDPLGSILGSLLGGGMQQGSAPLPSAPGTSGDPMSAILGSLLGGGMQGGTPNASALGGNSFLAPIVDAIAAKIGIPPQIAEAVVSFALGQLVGGQRDPQLVQMLAGRGTVSQKYLRDSGLVSQLTQRTGMDPKTATKSLQQVLEAFGTQMGEGTTDDRQKSIQSWLESK